MTEETKPSLLKDPSEYPNVAVDTESSEDKRRIWRGTDENHYLNAFDKHRGNPFIETYYPGLGLYPNVSKALAEGKGTDLWCHMPATDRKNSLIAQTKSTFGRQSDPDEQPYNINNARFWMGDDRIDDAANKPGLYLERFSPELTVLANFARSGHSSMNMEEKRALIQSMDICALIRPDPSQPDRLVIDSFLPENWTRLINPLGSMGNKQAYEGLTAYFYDIARCIQHFSRCCYENGRADWTNIPDSRYSWNFRPFMKEYDMHRGQGAFDTSKMGDKNTNDFFERYKNLNLDEAGRLLGNMAIKWGVDKLEEKTKNLSAEERATEMAAFRRQMRHLYFYLYEAKAIQCIKERARNVDKHEELAITAGDIEVITMMAMEDNFREHFKMEPLQVERELMEEFRKMDTPGSPEHAEIERLREENERPDWNKFRIYQYDLMREKQHAMKFMLENNEEGKKLMYGSR